MGFGFYAFLRSILLNQFYSMIGAQLLQDDTGLDFGLFAHDDVDTEGGYSVSS